MNPNKPHKIQPCHSHSFRPTFYEPTFAQQAPQNSNTGKITEIVIDLADEKGIDPLQIEKYNTLKKGQFFRLKIDNVNTYLYDLSVANEDIDTSAELPVSLLDLVDFGGIKSYLGNLNSVSEVVKKFVTLDSDAGLQACNAEIIQTALRKVFFRFEK